MGVARRRLRGLSHARLLLAACCCCSCGLVGAQITWGLGPLHVAEGDDIGNQQRLHDLLRRAYFLEGEEPHGLLPAVRAEIAEFRQRVPQEPWLALAVAMAKYYFSWYVPGTVQMDVESAADVANLLYASIQFSGCNRADLSPEAFLQQMCAIRWPFAIMVFSELGRDFATRYRSEEAAGALEAAVVVFGEMQRLPHYAPLVHWKAPYDINFNEAWFPGASPRTPLWEKARVPLVLALESAYDTIAGELGSLVERGLLEHLHHWSRRAEGQDYVPEHGVHAAHFTVGNGETDGAGRWKTATCREAPRTCELLASRPELRGCRLAGAAFVRLRPGAALKPNFGAAPGLRCTLPFTASGLGARMSVGTQTVDWLQGEAVVFDDTFIRQDWHAGTVGDFYSLQVSFCHPCEESQRPLGLYDSAFVTCGVHAGAAGAAAAAELTAEVPFAAAALWAASLPELALCAEGVSEQCPPDTQHGGANPLSALNTWQYAMNNLKAAMLHSGVQVAPELSAAVTEVLQAIQDFFAVPALDRFGAIVASARHIFDSVAEWLQQQPAAHVSLAGLVPAAGVEVPSDGLSTPSSVRRALKGGSQMPLVGFGTWKLEGTACYNAVKWALELGVRHVDTAEAYGNEAEVGRAIRDSAVPRAEVFITTKATSVALGMAEPSYLETILNGQLQALQTDYVDVYMLHAPGPGGVEHLRAVWPQMEAMHDLGKVRALGASNFGVAELEELWAMARVKPAYVQNIFKVYKPGEQIYGGSTVGLLDWARGHGVAVVGYSAINAWPHMLLPREDPHVQAVARAKGRTTSQVLHRWALQHGVAVIPKASSTERIRENVQLFDFALSSLEMALLDGLATLSESTHAQALPAWSLDVFSLQRR